MRERRQPVLDVDQQTLANQMARTVTDALNTEASESMLRQPEEVKAPKDDKRSQKVSDHQPKRVP